MVKLEFRWIVWLVGIFLLMMIFQGPRIVSSAGGSVVHAAYKTAGDFDKGLRALENCGSACHRH